MSSHTVVGLTPTDNYIPSWLGELFGTAFLSYTTTLLCENDKIPIIYHHIFYATVLILNMMVFGSISAADFHPLVTVARRILDYKQDTIVNEENKRNKFLKFLMKIYKFLKPKVKWVVQLIPVISAQIMGSFVGWGIVMLPRNNTRHSIEVNCMYTMSDDFLLASIYGCLLTFFFILFACTIWKSTESNNTFKVLIFGILYFLHSVVSHLLTDEIVNPMKLIPISYWSPYWMYWLLCGFVASFLASLLFKRIYNSLIPRLLQHTHEPSQTTSDVSSELSYNMLNFNNLNQTQTGLAILIQELIGTMILTGVSSVESSNPIFENQIVIPAVILLYIWTPYSRIGLHLNPLISLAYYVHNYKNSEAEIIFCVGLLAQIVGATAGWGMTILDTNIREQVENEYMTNVPSIFEPLVVFITGLFITFIFVLFLCKLWSSQFDGKSRFLPALCFALIFLVFNFTCRMSSGSVVNPMKLMLILYWSAYWRWWAFGGVFGTLFASYLGKYLFIRRI
ncbi:uncharacterized protein LOC109604950 [Aethina tumida]|uniref:uncharacterized protein LOC109604950 n=1 Tax=Aethina tumida TaxID=116153 RepID=UPI002149616E|nr:uncharacterized protein LOC109604950 [Aethina tumida]